MKNENPCINCIVKATCDNQKGINGELGFFPYHILKTSCTKMTCTGTYLIHGHCQLQCCSCGEIINSMIDYMFGLEYKTTF